MTNLYNYYKVCFYYFPHIKRCARLYQFILFLLHSYFNSYMLFNLFAILCYKVRNIYSYKYHNLTSVTAIYFYV